MSDFLKEYEAKIDKLFNDLQKPNSASAEILGNGDPQGWRDRYFFNNGVKAIGFEHRVEIDYMVRLLYLATKALTEIDNDVAKKALNDIRAVKKEEFI